LAKKPVTLLDRLGNGDTWNVGSYCGLLMENFSATGITKDILVGNNTATLIKQTLMFDLPMVDREFVSHSK
jgi:hypothetical protein